MDRDDQFAWGPLALGSYGAMLSLTVVVALYFSHYLGWYVALLLFLGIGLKPLLVRTGLAARLGVLFDSAEERRWRGVTRKRRREIEQQERDKRYRYRHKQDPKLPKNW